MRGDGKEILTHVEDETRTDAAEANMLKMKEKQDTSHSELACKRSLKVNMFMIHAPSGTRWKSTRIQMTTLQNKPLTSGMRAINFHRYITDKKAVFRMQVTNRIYC